RDARPDVAVVVSSLPNRSPDCAQSASAKPPATAGPATCRDEETPGGKPPEPDPQPPPCPSTGPVPPRTPSRNTGRRTEYRPPACPSEAARPIPHQRVVARRVFASSRPVTHPGLP